jgi:VWFA-related protein
MKGLAFALGIVLLHLAPPVLRAQEGKPVTPVFQSNVSLVLLPVFVVDRDGRAVRGLQAEDFEVREDGRPSPIVSFRYVDTTASGEEAELPLTSAARRRFLLLFDKSFTELGGLDRARRAASDFVRHRLASSDLAAVATFDVHNGVRLVANFTDDRVLLAHAVETLGVPSLTHVSDPLALAADQGITDLTLQLRANQGATNQALVDDVASVLVRQMRAAEDQSYLQNVALLFDGLEDLARALRGVEGRKQVLYFSAGFDARMLVGQWGSEQQASADSVLEGRLWEVDSRARYGDNRLRNALARVTQTLAGADTVVHSIDVTGLGVDRSLTQVDPSRDFVRNTMNRESLSFLAAETGGRLFKDASDLKPALAEMAEMTSRYYVLGVQPEREKGPGTYHKVKVTVDRKGVKLSHRPGYFEHAAPAQQSPLQRQFELAELVTTGEGQNEVPFDSLCLPFPEPGDRQTLGLVVQVPRESLRWSDAEPSSVEVYGYAVGEDGTVRDHLAQLARVDPGRADPQGRARGLSFFGAFRVPPGRYTVRLMVRQGETGKSAVRFLDVTVPPYDPRTAFALPPLVLDEPDRWLSMDIGRSSAGQAGQPFRLEAEPFVPRTSFEVRPGAAERLALIVWDARAPGDPAADVEIRSSLTSQDGRAVPPGRLKVEAVERDPGGRRTFLFRYTPDALQPGDYTLRIGLGEGGRLAEAYTLLRFRAGS